MDINKRIATLEQELSKLRAEVHESPLNNRKPQADAIYVDDEADLYLESCPAYVRHLLDNLPVQVFFKKPDLTPEKGREYTYMNKRALDILGWSSARGRFDGEAFDGGPSNPEWSAMVEVENATVQTGERIIKELRWTSPLGDEFRINTTTNLAVRSYSPRSDASRTVGFCAIAQDLTFRELQRSNQIYLDIMLHEYGNFCNSIIGDVLQALDSKDSGPHLARAIGRATVAKDIAKKLVEAFHPDDTNARRSVLWVVNELQELAMKWKAVRLTVSPSIDSGIRDAELGHPRLVIALLVQLIANAEKHTPDAFRINGDAEITLGAAFDEAGPVVWTVGNRATDVKWKLDLSDKGRTATLGGSILGNLIRSTYKTQRPEEYIRGPVAVDPTHVTIQLCLPEGVQ